MFKDEKEHHKLQLGLKRMSDVFGVTLPGLRTILPGLISNGRTRNYYST